MPIKILDIVDVGEHRWALAIASCKLDQEDDLLVTQIAGRIREAYGEDALVAMAGVLAENADEPLIFDEKDLREVLREGLPDPNAEGGKPPTLTVYRSQSAEVTGKEAIAKAYAFKFPVFPQQASLNANQPILGFDGWGISEVAGADTGLVLIQVKATDEDACPPGEATKLAAECQAVPNDRSKLTRALAVMTQLAPQPEFKRALLEMLLKMRNGGLPRMTICPVIVRGVTAGHHDDMKPVRDGAALCRPANLHGVVISIGVDLAEFGRKVMKAARKAA